MTYRGEPVTQRDGHPLENSNCMSAAAASGIRYEVLGGKTGNGTSSNGITAGEMRDRSGDSSGGQNSDEIQRSWQAYGEDPAIRDGRPFADVVADLKAGRAVMLQVWHATVGGVCLSGSGSYGHGIHVNPESREGDNGREWIVSDPWCKPAKWGWIRESKLKAGAEEWYRRCTREAGGDAPSIALIVAAARRLMDRYYPGHEAPPDDPPGAGGGGGVLFVSTRAHQEGDMSINVSANAPVVSAREVHLTEGIPLYGDGELTDKLGTLYSTRWAPLMGTVVGSSDARAVVINTGLPYEGEDDARPTIVYVKESDLGDIRATPEPPPPSDDELIAARDAEWRNWLTAAPPPLTGLLGGAEAILAWAAQAPDADEELATADVSSVGE